MGERGLAVSTRSDRSAVVLAADADLRETIACVVGELSGFLVECATDLDDARRALSAASPSVVIVAPGWLDADVDELLSELSGADPAVVVIGARDRTELPPSAVFVDAPFDVDTLLSAIEEGLAAVRCSRGRIAIANPPALRA